MVHHSGTRGGTPEDFARYHVYVNGWPGIGYHYVISREGTVYKTNALSTISYHARGANMESVGLCLVGNFNLDIPSGQQLDSLNSLLLILRHHLPRSRVVLHREVPSARTSCPGMRFPVAKLVR
ncbi:MAG: hypothetical protein A2Y63_06690 [Candidatus Riflebacteria bacterium RBG_13_59_9]|nr:MAG: hypothetical protein A2Y63_06690 [Candidatus Riflebacteria bacterium RBG_13_59_9]